MQVHSQHNQQTLLAGVLLYPTTKASVKVLEKNVNKAKALSLQVKIDDIRNSPMMMMMMMMMVMMMMMIIIIIIIFTNLNRVARFTPAI